MARRLMKDLDAGLIDFPTLYHDNEVYSAGASARTTSNFGMG